MTSRIRILGFNEKDCNFAANFACGVSHELYKVKAAQDKFEGSTRKGHMENKSVFGFFGKSSLLVEGIVPASHGKPHLLTMMGVPGCGKTTHVKEFLADVFSSQEAKYGRNPSVLLTSATNLQCKALFFAAEEYSQESGLIPPPVWCASTEWLKRMQDTASSSFCRNLAQASDKPVWPSKGSITVCTHDYVAAAFSSAFLSLIIIDEIGSLDKYRGSCVLSLPRRVGLLMGDPVQGRRPCKSLADTHVKHVSTFKSHSFRCPDVVMKVVEPAYAAEFGNPVELSGEVGRLHWCVNTNFDCDTIQRLVKGYGDNVLVLGFTHEAINDITAARTVDVAIGLVVVVVVIVAVVVGFIVLVVVQTMIAVKLISQLETT